MNTKLITPSDPYSQLAVRNAKYIKNCTELFMANKNITTLANFDNFVNLEILWVNDNRIEQLDGLDNCFRIKELYAQNNLLTTLNGSIQYLSFIQCLSLSNNRLRNLQATTKILGTLSTLKSLDLFGNPLAEESNYRMHVVSAISSLHVFDRHVVTDKEKKLAAISAKNTAMSQSESNKVRASPVSAISTAVKLMMREIKDDESHVKAAAVQRSAGLESQGLDVNHERDSKKKKQAIKNYSGLCHWQISYLRSFFMKHDKKKSGWLFKEAFDESILEMKDYGAILVNESLVSMEADSDTMEERSSLSAAVRAFGDESGDKICWLKFLECCMSGVADSESNRFFWKCLNHTDLKTLASDMFEKAKVAQKKSSSLPDSSEQKLKLINEAHELSITACRLEALILSVGDLEKDIVSNAKVPARLDIFTTSSYKRETHYENLKTAKSKHQKQCLYKLKGCKGYASLMAKRNTPNSLVLEQKNHNLILQ